MTPLVLLLTLATAGQPALAQTATAGSSGPAWFVWEQDEPKRCWAASAPVSTVNTRDGQEVSVRRGNILLLVSFYPGDDVAEQLSFTGGYPFDPDVPVTLVVGGRTYELPTEGEWAWAPGPRADDEIIAAFDKGGEAELTGLSTRGTTTKDTFSLFGFTAAVEEASARCGL